MKTKEQNDYKQKILHRLTSNPRNLVGNGLLNVSGKGPVVLFTFAETLFMFRFRIIFIDQESEGEKCTGCKEKIEGKKWVMMLDFDDPVNFPPAPLNVVYCEECYSQIREN